MGFVFRTIGAQGLRLHDLTIAAQTSPKQGKGGPEIRDGQTLRASRFDENINDINDRSAVLTSAAQERP
jgi:hypothetical protein